MQISYNITIKGKVQGVAFRKYAKNKASDLGLNGFVRNQPNGDVYIQVEGEEKLVNEFIEWCHFGSPMAKVDSVELETSAWRDLPPFTIKF
jgi:acylphosphatase